ncbi:hypothetical protein QNM99_29995 [Pseudomonas sp. PCH446]
MNDDKGDVKSVGYTSEYFDCGSAAFPSEHRELVERRLGWSDLGIGHNVAPYAYEDGITHPLISFSTMIKSQSALTWYLSIHNLLLVEGNGY